MKRRAFTLIELLVVIAIIAILAAILFPVFAQAKAAAKNSVSLSNTKQGSLGVIMYSTDADDQFPLIFSPFPSTATDALAGSTYTWQNTVQPYIKNWGIMVSPLSKLQNTNPVLYNDPFLNYGMLPRAMVLSLNNWGDTEYAPNGVGTATVFFDGIGGEVWGNDPSVLANTSVIETWTTGNTQTVGSLSTTAVSSPADMIMLSDSNGPDDWISSFGAGAWTSDEFHYCVSWPGVLPDQWNRFGPISRYGQNPATPCIGTRAAGGSVTTAFTDGHAKGTQLGLLFTTHADSTGQLWYDHLDPAGN